MSRKSDESYMSVHPANLLAEWNFREFRRQANPAPEHDAAYEATAWPLEALKTEQLLPARPRLIGRIRARLQGVAGNLRQTRGRLGGI
jgi:hypothetical protein